MTHRLPPFAALLAGSALALGLAGCATTDAPAASGISVVATTTQVADFTQQVAGDAAQVTSLIQPNQSSHSFDPTAADLAALAEADVLVINGAGLEEWLDSAVEASGFAGVTIDASASIELRELDEELGHDEEEAHSEGEAHTEGEAHSEEEEAHSEEEEAHSEDDDHGHDGGDPHTWTSVANATAMVDAIADGLAEVDADNAEAFESNAASYTAQLAALDGWIIENMQQVDASQRLMVSNHEAFGYFVDAYDITFVGAVIPSFDDNAEVSAADIDGLVDAIRDSGAPAVFSETSLSPAAADTIASEAGVAVFSGEQGLYGDSLGPAGSAGETYIGSMIHNATVLLEAWGATVTPLPAELSE